MPRHSGFSDSFEIQEERQWARGNQGATMFRPPANIGPRKVFTDRGHKSVEQNTEWSPSLIVPAIEKDPGSGK